MAEANFNPNVSRSKTPRRLSPQDLERLCGIEPHAEKKCDFCGVPLAFPKTYTRDTMCYSCCAIIESLSSPYWRKVQQEYEAEILNLVIQKKLLLDSGEDFGERGGDEIR